VLTGTNPPAAGDLAFAGHQGIAGRVNERWRSFRRALTDPHVILVVICLAHAAAALIFVVAHHMWWEQDETVYLSQVAPHAQALIFTPPRARGIPALLYPAVHVTTRVGLVRTYLIALGTLGMYFGFRPWLRLGYGRVVPGAALLLSSLWAATFFGAETQPNFMVAVLCLAAVGYLVVALRATRAIGPLLILGGVLALIALIRPSDATWLTGALVLGAIGVSGGTARRRLLVGLTLILGLGLGWSEWVIEAYASYGGFLHRLHQANADNTPGLHFSLLTQASAVNGPTLCRPCTGLPVSTAHIAWWFAIPPLLVLGLLRTRNTQRFGPLALATAAGVALLLEYVLTVAYAAPRFLLPSYALLSLPVAAGIAAIVRARARRSVNAALIAVVAAAIGCQIVAQNDVLRHNVSTITASRNRYVTAADRLRAAGIHAPCIVYGRFGPPVAFALGCNDRPIPLHVPPPVATDTTVVAMTDARDTAKSFTGWEQIHFNHDGMYSHWVAHVFRGGRRPDTLAAGTTSDPSESQPVG
jgi:hypothetical protein